MAESNPQEVTTAGSCRAAIRDLPPLTHQLPAERLAAINATNGSVSDVESAVRREFAAIDWKRPSRASIVCRITAAIQGVDSGSAGVLNKATRTVIQEIYAMDEWPTTKRAVLNRATAAIRRLKLGS